MINTTKIYLVEKCFGDCNKVYIGKTKSTRENNHKLKYGDNISYTIIDEINSLDSKEWKPLESFWINYFKFLGFEVQNKNDGGGGLNEVSTETRTKMSQSALGKVKSLEHRQNLSNSLLGKSKSPQHLLNIKNSNRVIKHNNETREKISKSKLGKEIKTSTPVIQYNLKGEFIREWSKISHALKYLNKVKDNGDISSVCKGKQKTAFGYIWKYK